MVFTKLISILRIQTTYETSFFLLCKRKEPFTKGKYTNGPVEMPLPSFLLAPASIFSPPVASREYLDPKQRWEVEAMLYMGYRQQV